MDLFGYSSTFFFPEIKQAWCYVDCSLSSSAEANNIIHYCLSMATMFTRTHHNIALFVHCLSCQLWLQRQGNQYCTTSNIIIIIISNLSNDRSKASSKTIPPHSAIQGFLLQLTVSSPVRKVIQQLLTPSSSSSCHFYLPLYLSFNNLLQKAVST